MKKNPVLISVIVLVVICVGIYALPHHGNDLFRTAFAYARLLGWRVFLLALTALVGFLAGALFSPSMKAFRRLLWIGLAAMLVLFSLPLTRRRQNSAQA